MLPAIGITTGDPRGIGLEVIFKALPPLLSEARWILFTDHAAIEANRNALSALPSHRWIDGMHQTASPSTLSLLAVASSNAQPGARALAYLQAASDAALNGQLQAIVTAPVSKEAIGPRFYGQTEWLAERAQIQQFAMAFFTPTFKVVLATIHLPLRVALDRISEELYLRLIPFVDSELRRFGFDEPRIAIAGINPHAGEGGMFGREDIDQLEPAVDQCRSQGIDVSGPFSADSLYYRAHTGEFDVVIAPYHDQGLAPVKLIAHGTSTNVTLGLPYVRTSPDHGTAFDIAGTGVADPSGMRSALQCALDLVGRQSSL
jgi:4-hydroxythreonine-4-phosphate dehydrogenase